jgi:hypothetical protein
MADEIAGQKTLGHDGGCVRLLAHSIIGKPGED